MLSLEKKPVTPVLKEDVILHNKNVGIISGFICEALDMSYIDKKIVNSAAIYHDIGKSSVEESILYKPAKLDKYEFEEVKKHARYGYNNMKKNANLRNYALYVLYHHENYCGGGYFNLKGDDIPYPSRILRLADYFDALGERRPHREPYTLEEALKILENDKSVFDPKIYDAFLRNIENGKLIEGINGLYESKSIVIP